MTDPLDTDALRAWAVDARDVASSGGSGPNLLLLCATNLIAAADEVDRLRAQNEHFAGELSAVRANRNHAVDEYQRLRAVIGNAPHEDECMQGLRGIPCDCWKADAL